jgi:hypothetical protein
MKVDEKGEACDTCGDEGIAFTVLVGKAKGKILIGRHRRRWEATIIMDIKNGMGGHEWVNLAEDRNNLRSVMHRVEVRYGNETNKCTQIFNALYI